MSVRWYLGIDPGASGGYAAVEWRDGAPMLRCVDAMPRTETDVFEGIAGWVGPPTLAVIEHVHSFPEQGVASAFTFGRNYGFLRGCLIAAGIPFQEVQPRTWQKALGIAPRGKGTGETQTEFKRRLRGVAQQRFPGVRVTLATADALLIALYTCLREEGRL